MPRVGIREMMALSRVIAGGNWRVIGWRSGFDLDSKPGSVKSWESNMS